jgi:hypothetical protein
MEAAAEIPAEPLPEALPLGFALDFPYHFTKRETANAGRKDARLRYTVEYLAGDANAIASSLEKSAAAAGFDSSHIKRFDDGRIYFIAKKRGYGDLRSVIQNAGSQKLRNSAAKGTLVMGWPLPTSVAASDTPEEP